MITGLGYHSGFMKLSPKRAVVAGSLSLAVALGGCSALPKDADGSYERARGNTLVVGVSPHEPWTEVDPSTGEVTGSEARLVEGFADSIGAGVDWRVGSETELAQWMEDGDIDVAIGGLEADSPWTDQLALTRPYEKVEDDAGKTHKMVMGVGLGENKMLVELERYLSEEEH